ncbi:LCB3 (YJL134W) and YSR3 (YKR053C) [Zygosaccharomyces parabailii]|uniref:BN860_05490g1_1 n=1 Tax=Zygosaccharomyces bailii (strain CLIB 213 / ATCC 58445 / CBS 680 / BCRC 21525 / NBRC 1098 / NCYC 1416 / NRRL Y-2227) TaxID=1333698 RepID=A0A8J2T3G8_ZYGB2|nr:LCB3 (YJL134W) and YSR3 (YKR053C) [Zygosaccharomyces parabailii]CDF87399.1 BN860_05490g1_1 [Zygosaccharomyces bailii CLIB 213]CDH15536.1 related to Dihydrosphingosine 1-phosphate phosphatase LCB3 [Zygosaccharomyces bailii ISA1307]
MSTEGIPLTGVEPNDFQRKHPLKDPGNHGPDHFKGKMSKLRFSTRQALKRFTDTQSDYLSKWQLKHKTKWRSIYFAGTAVLGSHTFYVLCLPTPAWAGSFEGIADLVYILAYSIYLSGYLKDYWCLPRPRSPPLHRITLSEYTTMEYGAPSSHTANATGASLYLLWTIAELNISVSQKLALSFLVVIYYLTLVVGRIYCGMHGLLDIISGALVGIVCILGRVGMNHLLADFQCGDYWWFPILSTFWGLLILFKHIKPVDECPCFADSVAFVGVVGGIEWSKWILQRLGIEYGHGMRVTGAPHLLVGRLLVGGLIVVIWKYVIGKPLVYSFLIHVLRLKDDRPEKIEERRKYANAKECPPYIGEAKIDIVGRYAIYAGIPPVVLLACPPIFKVLNLLNLPDKLS